MPQRCVAPNCLCSKRSDGKCTKPNRWNLFRAVSRGRYTRSRMSTKYKKAKKSVDDSRWCKVVSDFGMDDCVDTTAPHNTTDGTNTCDDLLKLLVAQDPPSDIPLRWKRVMRVLHTRSLPESVLSYSTAQINFITNEVGEAFFGKEFVPFLRSTRNWKIKIKKTDETSRDTSASFTDHQKSITYINGALIDKWKNKIHTVTNDGIPMNSALEWIAHLIAHELLHCLLVIVCGKSRGHTDQFMQLNTLLLGGTDKKWKTSA